MNIRKKHKSQWTEGNGGSDKAACQQRCANMASVSPSVHIQPVTSAVITNVMPKTVEQKFPECKDSDQIHSFHHCKEKSCMLQDLEDELFAQEQVFKKLLVNMCTPTDDAEMRVLIMKMTISHLHLYGRKLSCQLCTQNN